MVGEAGESCSMSSGMLGETMTPMPLQLRLCAVLLLYKLVYDCIPNCMRGRPPHPARTPTNTAALSGTVPSVHLVHLILVVHSILIYVTM